MSYLNILICTEFIICLSAILVTKFDILSPGTVSILFFFISTVMLKVVDGTWDINISGQCYRYIVLGLLIMLLAEMCSSKFKFTIRKRNLSYPDSAFDIVIVRKYQILFIWISVICWAIYVFEIVRTGEKIGVSGFYTIGAVSNGISDGIEKLSFLGKVAHQYCTLIPYPFCWVFSKKVMKKNEFKSNLVNFVPIGCGLLVQFFSANRHNMLRIIFAVALCCYLSIRKERTITKKRRRKIIKNSLLMFVGFAFLFYVIRDVVKVSIHQISFIEYIAYYLGSPIVLFGKYLRSPDLVRPQSLLWGETCFTGFYATLARWGIVENVTAETQHTVIGGLSSIRTGNTYTFFMRPFHDFRVMGIIVLTLLLYLFACSKYHKVLCNNAWSVKSYRKKVYATIVLSYFYYMFPLAVSDFYVTIESKAMNVVYLTLIYVISRLMIKVRAINDAR